MMHMKTKVLLLAGGTALGALGGFLYWKYVGCVNGTCAITSKPLNSTVYFAIMGLLLANMFIPASKSEKTGKPLS